DHAPARRVGKQLILATKEFEPESVGRSWFEVVSTFAVYGAAAAGVIAGDSWVVCAGCAVLAGLVQFRMLSLFHAHLHKALLWDSDAAQWLFRAVGVFILVPRPVWMQTHNFHHINNGKIDWTSIGSYTVWTREKFDAATPTERRRYLWSRHPFKILFGYIWVGIYGMCVQAFLRTPKKNWAGPLALVLHIVGVAAAWRLFGLQTGVLLVIVPCFINHAIAAYLFYAQHNFPGTRFFAKSEWSYTEAAVAGSSYFRMGAVMRWMTADIGYHHVHHLNHKIPTYRSAEAMEALPELQSPTTTSWRPHDVWANLRLAVWNPKTLSMEALGEHPPKTATA
ncbi:MAG: fatty acid desaturase, partial [Nannocystaceae bacterium]|nr:fatty acid desaturase [Nannocystaceae bacterium]